jgi:hypothetical protein
MQDSATPDAHGIDRFNVVTEWPRYREANARHGERLKGRRVIGTSKPGTAEKLRIGCSLYGRTIVDFVLKGKRRRHTVGLPDKRNR